MAGENDDDSDKSHEASKHKLDEARKKGEIARSPDLLTATAYAGILLTALALGQASLFGLAEAMLPLIDHPHLLVATYFGEGSTPVVGRLIADSMAPVLPWVIGPGLLVVAVLIAQKGIVVAPQKLAPKWSRLSLLENAKNKFGRRGLFEFAKSFTKLMVYSAVLGLFLSAQMAVIAGSLQGSATGVVSLLMTLAIKMMTIVAVVAAVIGGIDFLWQHQEHLRKNRMSHKELRDEYKESEGDPAMKQQRRARAQEIAMNQMMRDVPTADVIIVNPTRYAVALKWNRETGNVPVCVAKGVDHVAARIREAGQEAMVPIHSDPPTARALYATVEIGQSIQHEHYRPVAAAIRFADAMRKRVQERRF
ncbi:EscU/YscU/HrcU family type III secretion system export apparatus switch protein [Puniceibacterium confluentis]|uniref:EscU/YscU/HrcU family type III secretion system export apparatus switch protein n=1 Tax=Puniceibacterium confluentis TaxID=1958944 RepID=UPI0011B456F6|nr:flagellar type III secretion system protein FlhB [Puniceibacterium confluentis]